MAGIELLGSAELDVPDDIKDAFDADDLPMGLLEGIGAAEENPFSTAAIAAVSDAPPQSEIETATQGAAAKAKPAGPSSRREKVAGQSSRRTKSGGQSSRREKTAGQSSRRGKTAGQSSRRGERTGSGRTRSSRRQGERDEEDERLPSGRIQNKSPIPFMVAGVVGAIMILTVAVAFLLKKRARDHDVAAVTPSATAVPGVTPDASATPSGDPLERARRDYFAQRIADLEADLDLVEKDPPEDRGYELDRLRGVLDQLRLSPFAKENTQRLNGSAMRLKRLARETSSAGAEGGKQAEEAWTRLGAQVQVDFERALRNRGGGWQREIERQLGGASFRTDLRREVGVAARDGHSALTGLASDARWIGLFDAGTYDQLVEAGDVLLPEATRAGEAWQALRGKLVTNKRLSEEYAAAHRAVLLAAATRDLDAAHRALAGKRGPWIGAIKKLLDLDRYVAWFKAKDTGGASSGGTGSGTGSNGSGSSGGEGTQTRDPARPSATLLEGDWRVRFRLGAKRYRKAKDEDKPKEATALASVVDEAVQQAGESHEICVEAIELLDEHERLVEGEAALHPGRDKLYQLYFDEEFRLASGPMTFYELDEWCEKRKREEWRAKIAPWLKKMRLVGQDGKDRERERKARAEGIAAAKRFVRSRRSWMASEIEGLIGWMRAEGYAPEDARETVIVVIKAAVSEGDPFAGARLEALVQALPRSSGDAKLQKTFERKRLELIEALRKKTFKAIAGAIKAGEPGMGFDFFQYLLRVDPENEKAHKKLGHVKVQGEWLRKFEASQLKKGLRWDPKLAWVRAKAEDKYRQGQVFDYQSNQWRSLNDANRDHAKHTDPWVIRTEHFELRSTADLDKSAWIADRLEAFYLVLFRHYDMFFAHKGGASLVFGVSAQQQKPLVVNFYRSRQQYVSYAKATPGSAGIYDPGRHASFFYDQGHRVTTLQHEITHQILGETLSGGRTSAWLAEGAAVYLEGVAPRNGQLRLGPLLENEDIAMYVRFLPRGSEHTFTTITAFHDQGAWGQNLDHRNYRGAGAAVYFLVHMDRGRYRGDFLRMLKQGYLGQRSDPERYMNLSKEVLEELMQRFYEARSIR